MGSQRSRVLGTPARDILAHLSVRTGTGGTRGDRASPDISTPALECHRAERHETPRSTSNGGPRAGSHGRQYFI